MSRQNYGGTLACPKCGARRNAVLNTVQHADGQSLGRRRECHGCGFRFNTLEMTVPNFARLQRLSRLFERLRRVILEEGAA